MTKIDFQGSRNKTAYRNNAGLGDISIRKYLVTDRVVNGEGLLHSRHWSRGATLTFVFASSVVLWSVIILAADVLLKALFHSA